MHHRPISVHRGMTIHARRSRLLVLGLIGVLQWSCSGERGVRDPLTLVAALDGDPGHLNPAITTNGGIHTAAGLLYDGLLAFDSTLAPIPALAVRWDVLDAGARYRFHLRAGVRWHDGKAFTAADVKFTFDSLLLRFHARTRASMSPTLLAVVVVDDSTVEFRFRRPYAPLLQQLDVVEAPILPMHIYAGSDPLRNPANLAPVGTGPYRFVSYNTNNEIRYAANDAYFGGVPPIRNVILRVIPDAGTRVIALEAGEVDWLFTVPGPDRIRLRSNPRVQLVGASESPGGSNCILTVGFNLDRPVFRDVRVRRAIAHGVNRQQFVERVAFGDARIADAPISSQIGFAYRANLPIPAFDTVAAGALLAAAGWKRAGSAVRTARGVPGVADGAPFEITFKVLPSQAVYGDLLRAQLRVLGIDVRVVALETVVFAKTVFTDRDFDTAIAAYCNGTDPEIGVRRQYVTASIAPVPFSNMAGYRNTTMDSLFDAASAALAVDERRRLYGEIQALAVRDQPYVWLLESLGTRAHSSRCRGFGRSSHFAARAVCSP